MKTKTMVNQAAWVVVALLVASLAQGNANAAVQVGCDLEYSPTHKVCLATAEAGHPAPYTFLWQASGPAAHAHWAPFDCSGDGGGSLPGFATCPVQCFGSGLAAVTVEVYDGNTDLVGVATTQFNCPGGF